MRIRVKKKLKEQDLNVDLGKNAGDRGEIKSDVLGSYTGMSDYGEAPQQDADDL